MKCGGRGGRALLSVLFYWGSILVLVHIAGNKMRQPVRIARVTTVGCRKLNIILGSTKKLLVFVV